MLIDIENGIVVSPERIKLLELMRIRKNSHFKYKPSFVAPMLHP
jgi:hypothetical protein